MWIIRANYHGSVLRNDVDADGYTLHVTEIFPRYSDAVVSLGDEGRVYYQAAFDFVGEDRVLYTIGDGYGGASAASLVVLVSKPNTTPEVLDYELETTEGGMLTVDLIGDSRDPDGDELDLVQVSDPTNGAIIIR